MSWYPERAHPGKRISGTTGNTVDQSFLANVVSAPAAISTTNVHALIAQPTTGTLVVTSGFTRPDVPRTLRLVGNQATVAGNVVIEGRDADGDEITETVELNGTTPVETTRAFQAVTKITLPTRAAASDQVSIGGGSKIGIYHALDSNTLLIKLFNGAADAGTLAVHAEVSKNLYTPAGTLDGVKKLKLVYAV